MTELPKTWDFLMPSGGVLLSAVLGAMRDALADPRMHLVSATTLFCTPVESGKLTTEVRILRRGRTASQVAASMSGEAAQPGLEVIGIFARDRDGYPDVVEAERPDVPPPGALPPAPANPRWRMRFFDNFEQRLAYGHFSWEEEEWTPGPARYARWIKYREPPRSADGLLDVLAYPPVMDLMPPALVHKVGREKANFIAPSLDLTVHFFERTDREWLLVSGLCRRAYGGRASAQVELFDDTGRLLGYATQVMMLKTLRG